MCGICGFTKAQESDFGMLKKMCDKMQHRGPDGSGYYINDGIAFGHRRLSLVDLENGDQPIIRKNSEKKSQSWHADSKNFNKQGDFAIVMNGEIYNYKELKQELENLGYTFSTNSDTEVVLASYIEWGKEFLNKLRGMFAISIWDSKKQELFCARDFFGIKPFYYTMQNEQFMFASEIKVLLEHNNCPKKLNTDALEQYLCFQFSALNETFFKDIFVLEPGHFLTVDKSGNINIQQYWRPEFKVNKDGSSKDQKKLKDHKNIVEQIGNTMKNSVKYHNVADVEVGSLLSSGIDSSYNASLLQKINPSIQTFTVGFDAYKGKEDKFDGERNEIAWAEELAKILGVKNYSKTISKDEYWEVLPKYIWHMDEPHGDPSAVALYFVDKIASEHVKAVLSGEGADELFGGYTIYQTALSNKKLNWIPKPMLKAASKVLKKAKIRGSRYLERAGSNVGDWYYTNAYESAFSIEERKRVLKNPSKNIKNPQEITQKIFDEAKKDKIDDCAKMQYTDLHFWILGDILMKGDKMSMAHSLECRVPFLDKEVFEIASMLPTSEKLSSTQTKIALREAAKEAIPSQWASKKKLGFPVPIENWLREEKYYNIIKSEFLSDTANKYFNTKYLIEILDEHKNSNINNSRKIWIIYMFLLWHKVFFES